jgi:hypothetical protein
MIVRYVHSSKKEKRNTPPKRGLFFCVVHAPVPSYNDLCEPEGGSRVTGLQFARWVALLDASRRLRLA